MYGSVLSRCNSNMIGTRKHARLSQDTSTQPDHRPYCSRSAFHRGTHSKCAALSIAADSMTLCKSSSNSAASSNQPTGIHSRMPASSSMRVAHLACATGTTKISRQKPVCRYSIGDPCAKTTAI